MGKKKSKKGGKKKGGKGGTKNAAAAAAVPSSTPPDGALCWICLEEDDPNSEDRLARDCSCRGDASFAHFSCLLTYTRGKSEALYEAGNRQDFVKPWITCPNCNQPYQGKLAIKLAKALMEHMKGEYDPGGYNKLFPLGLIVEAVMYMCSVGTGEPDIIEEGKCAANEIISVARPESPVYYSAMKAHMCLGMFAEMGNDYKLSIDHYKKVENYYLKTGDPGARDIKYRLNILRRKLSGDDSESGGNDEAVANLRDVYQDSIIESGEDSVDAVRHGAYLGHYLFESGRTIEAQRLLTKVASRSRRVHGPDHRETIEAERILKRTREFRVGISSGHGKHDFQALCFEEEMMSYTVKGPILDPRREDEEETFHVAIEKILFAIGTPVVCAGLKNATHLNGKLGEVRGFKGNSFPLSLEVHFEDEGLKPVIVKGVNLRIAFELPDN